MLKKIACVGVAIALLQSCVDITPEQKTKLQAVKQTMPEYYTEVKNPNLAAGLGVLPLGIADFYNGNYGLGVANFFGSIIYPINISWTVVGAIDGANEKNYYATKNALSKAKKKELAKLQEKLEAKDITLEQYTLNSKKVEQKYDMDYIM